MGKHTLVVSLIALWLSACSQYDFTVNDRVVYTPEPLFEDFAAADPALHTCLKKAVKEYKISDAVGLKELHCAGAGIEVLAGIEVFTGLRRLVLGDNNIASLAPLAGLSSLESLELPNNKVVNPLPLYDLLSLRIVDLRGNPDLRCPRPQDLLRVVELSLPQHCSR